jgi:ankyrin repeat protein
MKTILAGLMVCLALAGCSATIHSAAGGNGDVQTVQAYLDRGTDVNLKDQAGATPLHYAAAAGRLQIVQLLLERGANPNVRTITTEQTPLHMAAMAGHAKVVQLLLNHKARATLSDAQGKTPLEYVEQSYLTGRTSPVAQLLRDAAAREK